MKDKIEAIIAKALAENGIKADQTGDTFWVDTDEGTLSFTVEYSEGDDNGECDGRIADIAPFSTMTVTAKVEWDFDDDVRNSGLAPEEYGLPSKEQKLVFTADELKVNDIVDVGDIEDRVWALDEGKLEEYISDKLTDKTGFCHNGFDYNYKIG